MPLLPVMLLISTVCLAESHYIVDHHDPINIDPQLSLMELVDLTLDKYPDATLIPAYRQEADALQRRGDSWLAGAPTAKLNYIDDAPGPDTGLNELEGNIELPLWNWGQREAGQQLAEKAQQLSKLQLQRIRLKVAGRVREALWDMALQKLHYEMSLLRQKVSNKLLQTIQRRVELGDLPRADYLLAKSELLKDRAQLVEAEAEHMHARKRYATLTQIQRIPATFVEQQSQLTELAAHPALAVISAEIERKKAELEWVKTKGSGQTLFAIGGKTERSSRADRAKESITFNLSVPFGGGAHLAPEIAAVNLQLAELQRQRDMLYRRLQQSLHEAEHALQVDRSELAIAKKLQEIAEAHLKMTRLSFKSGEINLMDLLRIQARTHNAIEHAKQQEIIMQRDIAFFNQAVGVVQP